MRFHIIIENYADGELSTTESKLRKQGYRLVRKNSESDLLPGEFIKQEHSRSMNSFGEERRWTLRWRVS
jgi:hypothetical protein